MVEKSRVMAEAGKGLIAIGPDFLWNKIVRDFPTIDQEELESFFVCGDLMLGTRPPVLTRTSSCQAWTGLGRGSCCSSRD